MPLSRPRPVKRTGASLHQFVQRIPADVKSKVRGMQLSIPIGDIIVPVTVSEKAQDIRVSLRTRNPEEARARQVAVVAYLEGVWRAVREGPRRLSRKQVLALAGEVYYAFIEACEEDPGPSGLWASVSAITSTTGSNRIIAPSNSLCVRCSASMSLTGLARFWAVSKRCP